MTTNYAYNAVGELIQAGSTTYSYDANGNPIQTGTVIGADNELLSDGTWNYSYDAAGNQIGKVNIATGETWTYVYNNANQLVSAVDESANGTVLQSETNTYDVFGQRIAETETTGGSTTTIEMSYDQNGTLYADLSSSDTITTRYISSPTGPDNWLARVSSSGSAWLLSDHLGSVRTVVALTGGTVLDQITFDPFGNIVSQTNAAEMGRLGFQGGQYDPLTSLTLYGSAGGWYNPATGRWERQDPLFPISGVNPYEYCANAPSNYTDPTGEIYLTTTRPKVLSDRVNENIAEATLHVTIAFIFPTDWSIERKTEFREKFKSKVEAIWNKRNYWSWQNNFWIVGYGASSPTGGGPGTSRIFWIPQLSITTMTVKRGVPRADYIMEVQSTKANWLGFVSSEGAVNMRSYPDGSFAAPLTGQVMPVGEISEDTVWGEGQAAAHEVGHLLGIAHPGQYLPLGRRPPLNSESDYMFDYASLMGTGTELRRHYFQEWVYYLQGAYPKESPYRVVFQPQSGLSAGNLQ